MKLKKIYNKHFPVKGFIALTIWPYIFVRIGKILTERGKRHETTHALQQLEMTIVGAMLAIQKGRVAASLQGSVPGVEVRPYRRGAPPDPPATGARF